MIWPRLGVMWVRAAILAAAACVAVPAARAQEADAGYPGKPIRMVVGYAPGGGADILGRLVAQRMGAVLGQQVVVENRPGAGQNIGASAVAHAPADGYTLLFSSSALSVNVSLYRKLDYDPVKDFAPVAMVGKSPNLLAVKNAPALKSVKDLLALGKGRASKLNFSSSGAGSTQHLAGEMLNRAVGLNAVHIPYKGTAPSLTAILSGEVDFTFSNIPSVKPFIGDGRVRALAITSAKRSPLFPDVPTMDEVGIPNFDVSAWYGVLAPAGTPDAIVKKLNAAINKAVAEESFKTQLEQLGVDPINETPTDFARSLGKEIAQWAQVIKAANITVE